MRKSKLLFLTATTAICTAPLYAAAQQADGGFLLEEAPEKEEKVVMTSSVELGLGWVSTDSFKFGEYSGHESDGLFGVANVDVHRHPPFDGDSTQYWELTGTNLGLESRRVRGEFGHQGTFKVFGEYDQIPHFRIEDAMTPYRGIGSDTLTLPETWTPDLFAAPTFSDEDDDDVDEFYPGFFPANDDELQEFDIHTERKRYGGGFSWNIMEGLELSANYRREEKDGLGEIAGLFGSNGGNPSAVLLPKPIDFTTDEFDVALAYADERFQGQLSYHLSLFENNEHSLTWDNPYDAQGSWDPSQDFDEGGQGRMALEPDNSAHQIAVSAGYMLSPTMRIAGNFSYGWMLQDDDFLPYTVNPDLSVPLGLPRNSLDGEVRTMHGNLVFTARPTPKSDLKLAYTFDDRDNDTPRDTYVVVHNDTIDQNAGGEASGDARINKPYSRRSHKIELEGGYRIMSNAKLGLGYEYETVERDFTEVEDTDEHTGKINLRASPTPTVTTWLEYAFSARDGSKYVSNRPFLVSHTDDYTDTLAGADLYENNPFLRKFYIADRRRHLVTGAVTAMPSDDVVLGLSGSYNNSDYHNTVIGLTDMTYASITGDVAFMPTEQLTLTGFVTYERGRYEQTGFERQGFGAGGSITPDTDLEAIQGVSTARGFWTADTKDHGFTVGAGVEWDAIPDRLKFTADYAYSDMTTEIDLSVDPGALISFQSLPDLDTKMHSVGITGEYMVQDNVSARLGYRFEYYDADDWATDGQGMTTEHFLGFGNESANYNAHVVWGSVVLHF